MLAGPTLRRDIAHGLTAPRWSRVAAQDGGPSPWLLIVCRRGHSAFAPGALTELPFVGDAAVAIIDAKAAEQITKGPYGDNRDIPNRDCPASKNFYQVRDAFLDAETLLAFFQVVRYGSGINNLPRRLRKHGDSRAFRTSFPGRVPFCSRAVRLAARGFPCLRGYAPAHPRRVATFRVRQKPRLRIRQT